MTDASASTEPERIGAYRIKAFLGKGGMGEVYLAWDERLERHVALKRLRVDSGDQERTRLRREARAVARLSHPAIVQIYDILDTPQGQYLVMEYVEGSTLTEFIGLLVTGCRQIDLRHAVDLACEIAEGLTEAHTKGLVHRDLKSDNVIVTPAGHARILDFGLARPLWQAEDLSTHDQLTKPGGLVGTAHAMSPEQAEGRAVDHRSDLFSFGILIYEMLTGSSPFRGESLLDTLRRVTGDDPTPLLRLRPGLPPELVHLVEQMLEKDPDRRPQNARLVARELRDLELPSTAPAARPGPTGLSLPRPIEANSPTASGIYPQISPDPVCEDPRAELPGAESTGSHQTVLRTLVLTDLIDHAKRIEELGDLQGAEVWGRHHRMARDLLARREGVVEVDHGTGFLFLFERPFEAVTWALAYQRSLAGLSDTLGVELRARAAIHLGEIVLRRNPRQDVARGARPFEVEGLARLIAGRVLDLAAAGQTLLTRSAFDLARRASVDAGPGEEIPRWLAHGRYFFHQQEKPVEIFEVGIPGLAPLVLPPDSEQARRAVAFGEEIALGWRPAAGLAIPRRPHWRLAERLGEGGFGEIWLAVHKSGEKRIFKFCFEIERLGALKREVTLFRLLRDALGQRDDITRIIDWNFEVAPYFLESEYTAGGDLVQWATKQGGLAAVPLPVRLELVAQVAEALHAAHSVGILHKDIKPANILITDSPSGGRPQARLTDFGLGLLTQRDRLRVRGITALGFSTTELSDEHSSGGTWHYMAPELTEGKLATLQADIYSLGVVLYQIVAGNFTRSLAPGWQRDVDDELLAEDIASLVDGSPDRRPRSALEVAESLRHLDERRERRDAERRAVRLAARASKRRRVATAVAILSTLVLGLVSLFAIKALSAQQEADRRRQQAEELIEFMLGDLRQKLEEVGRLTILDEIGEKAMAYFAAVPEEDLTTSELLSRSKALSQLGHVRFQQKNLEGATEAFQKSLALAGDLADRDPDNPEWQLGLTQSHYWVGYLLMRTKGLEGALTHFQAYRDIAERWAALEPDREMWQLELAYAHSNIASVLTKNSEPDGALRELATSADLIENLVARQPANSLFQLELSHVYSKMGTGLKAQGQLDAALERYQSALQIRRALVELEPDNFQRLRYLATMHNLQGDLLLMLGKPRQALEQYRADLRLTQRLADQDPENNRWRQELGVSHGDMGIAHRALAGLKSAEEHFRIQLNILEDLTRDDPDGPELREHLAWSHNSLASVLVLKEQPKASRHHVELALAILRPMAQQQPGDGETHRFLSTSLWLLGRAQADLGNQRQAQTSWEQAAAAIEPFILGSSDPLFLVPWVKALLFLGRTDQAKPVIKKLQTLGYREQEYLKLCRSRDLLPAVAEKTSKLGQLGPGLILATHEQEDSLNL